MLGYLIPVVNIDHHSIKAFPSKFNQFKNFKILFKIYLMHSTKDNNTVIINVVFGACSGLSAIIFGKLGDWTVCTR